MRIAVTGRNGQVARSLAERGARLDHNVMLLGRPELDLCGDPAHLSRTLVDAAPDVVVSAAAYTAVDKAEAEPELAFATNASGAVAVAKAAQSLGVPLIHLSTDYVFDGAKRAPYEESDVPAPAGVYGASKLAGEKAILEEYDNVAILRTAWVYSPFGSNFLKTMLKLAADRDEINVVDDQIGNPTSALDIADGVITVATNLAASDDLELRGVFHMAGEGEVSWADFAQSIFAASASLGGPSARVNRIGSADYPTAARRPANSRLSCAKLARVHGVRLPRWEASSKQIVRRILRERADK